MNVLDPGPASRPDRAASMIVHDESNARVIAFHLLPGQEVPVHTSDSSVIVHVTEGSGTFSGAAGATTLRAGQAASYAPGEPHGMRAGAEPLRFLAVVTPRPGG